MQFVNLETKRMYLKNIAVEDGEFMLEHFSNMEINQFLFDAVPFQNIAEALALIRFYEEAKEQLAHRWILIRKSDGAKMGTCGYHCWDEAEKKIDVGYDMQTKFRGCGYMQEALAAILLFAKEQLPVNRIEAHIYVDNLKSISLATKLGFSFEGQTELCQFLGKDYLHYIYFKNII